MSDNTDWYTLGAFRGCDAHDREHGINYAATMETYGPASVLAALTAADREGMFCSLSVWDDEPDPPDHRHCFATLDIRNADGDIVEDRCIPVRDVFDWWVGAVELRADMSDCPDDEPSAHARTYAFAVAAGAGRHTGAIGALNTGELPGGEPR